MQQEMQELAKNIPPSSPARKILPKLLSNIVREPHNEKFHTIKLTNPKIAEVGVGLSRFDSCCLTVTLQAVAVAAARSLLLAVGFEAQEGEEGESLLVLPMVIWFPSTYFSLKNLIAPPPPGK